MTSDGTEYIGTVVDEGANSMTMTLRTKNQITIQKSNIEERGISETSPMPDHLLYNLDNDPGEKDNLSGRQKERVAAMRAEHEEWQTSVVRSLNGEDYR